MSIKISDSTDKRFYLLVEYTPFRLRRNIAARLAPFIAIFLLGYIRKVCALRNQSQKAVILTTLLRLCRYRANPTFCLTLSIPRKRGYFVEVSERDRGEWCEFANFKRVRERSVPDVRNCRERAADKMKRRTAILQTMCDRGEWCRVAILKRVRE